MNWLISKPVITLDASKYWSVMVFIHKCINISDHFIRYWKFGQTSEPNFLNSKTLQRTYTTVNVLEGFRVRSKDRCYEYSPEASRRKSWDSGTNKLEGQLGEGQLGLVDINLSTQVIDGELNLSNAKMVKSLINETGWIRCVEMK